MTQKDDKYRPPYARSFVTLPRRTSFLGTINEQEFLVDGTGDRRSWVMGLSDIDLDSLNKINVDKVWGQVYKLYQTGFAYWLDKKETKVLYGNISCFRSYTAEEQAMRDGLDWDADKGLWSEITASDIAYTLGLMGNSQAKIGRILAEWQRQGIIPEPHYRSGSGAKKWFRLPPVKSVPGKEVVDFD